MARGWKRLDLGLWLLQAGALVAGTALVVAVLSQVLLHASPPRPDEGGLLPVLRRLLPGARTAILGGFLAAVAGAVACASEGPPAARALAAGAAAALLGTVAAAIRLGGFASLLVLRFEGAFAFAAVAANVLGWWLALAHAGAVAAHVERADLGRAAARCRATIAFAGLWLLGALWLSAAFHRARDAGEPTDALGTTLVVVGAGWLAFATAAVAGSLHVLAALREALAHDPPLEPFSPLPAFAPVSPVSPIPPVTPVATGGPVGLADPAPVGREGTSGIIRPS